MPLLAGLGPLGVPELLIIAFIVVLVFGVGRLPEVGGAVGKSLREFRKSTRDEDAASGQAGPVEPMAREMPPGNAPLLYLCTGKACQPPTNDPAKIKQMLVR